MAWRARGVHEVRVWDQAYQFLNHRIACRSALGLTQNKAIEFHILTLTQTLIGEEEECLVSDDGTAEVAPEHVALEGAWFAGREVKEVPRVESVVSEELVQF